MQLVHLSIISKNIYEAKKINQLLEDFQRIQSYDGTLKTTIEIASEDPSSFNFHKQPASLMQQARREADEASVNLFPGRPHSGPWGRSVASREVSLRQVAQAAFWRLWREAEEREL